MNQSSTINECVDSQTTAIGRGSEALRTLTGRIRVGRLSRSSAALAESECPSVVPEVSAAALRQSGQLPAFAPLLEELEAAGWSSHRRTLSGNFHDWLLLENRTLLVMVGHAVTSQASSAVDPVEAALVTQAAWSSIRSHADHATDAGTLLSLASRCLWANAGGVLFAAVTVALIDFEGGKSSVAMAGDCMALRVRAAGAEPIAARQPVLGMVADFTYLSHTINLSVRDRVVLVADEPSKRPAKALSRITTNFSKLDAEAHRRMMAADAIGLVRDGYDRRAGENGVASLSIVAVRRR